MLTIILGTVYSGKNEVLNKLFLKHNSGNKIKIFNKKTDRSIYCKNKYKSIVLNDTLLFSKLTFEHLLEFDLIGFIDLQFFDIYVTDLILKLVEKGKNVIITSWNNDLEGKLPKQLIELLPKAERIYHLVSMCFDCGKLEGLYTIKEQEIKDYDYYLPVCRKCYNERRLKNNVS